MTAESESMTKRVARGSGIMLAAKLLQRSLGLVSTLVLARLLLPADFAVVAVAMLVVKLLDIICNTGARQYIVQVEELGPRSVDTAWTLDLGCRLLASLLLLSFLPVIQWFWADTSITAATAWLAPTLVLVALHNPQLHLDERAVRYDRLFRVDLARKVVSTIVTIAIAIVYESFWAIVLGAWTSAIIGIVVSYQLCTLRPRLCLEGIKMQWEFSKWMLSRGFVGYLRAQIDTVFASRMFDAASFGQYTLARELTVLPSTDVVVPLVQPLLATFSRAREKKGELARQLCAAILLISSIIMPVCMLLHAEGDVILLLALGAGWEPAAALVSPMVPLLFGFAFGGLTNFMFLAQGKVRTLFWYDVVSLAVVAATLIMLGQVELHRFVQARAWLAVAIAVTVLIWGSRHIGIPILRMASALASPVLAAIASGMIAEWVVTNRGFPHAELANTALYGALLVVIYSIVMLITGMVMRQRSESWDDVMSFIEKLLRDTISGIYRIFRNMLRPVDR